VCRWTASEELGLGLGLGLGLWLGFSGVGGASVVSVEHQWSISGVGRVLVELVGPVGLVV